MSTTWTRETGGANPVPLLDVAAAVAATASDAAAAAISASAAEDAQAAAEAAYAAVLAGSSVHNVKDYSAIGDGDPGTDDTGAFIDAIDAAIGSGKPVLVPRGIFPIDPAQVVVPNYVKLFGYGAGTSMIRKRSAGLLIDLAGNDAHLIGVHLDGHNFAGGLINVSAGAAQVMSRLRLEGDAGVALSFAIDAGANSSVNDSLIFPRVAGDIVLQCPGLDTSAMGRRWSDLSLGAGFIHLGGVNDVFMHAIFARNLTMSATGNLGVHMIGCKLGSVGAATTLYGTNTVVVGCTIAGDVVLAAQFSASVYVGNRDVSLTDNSTDPSNIVIAGYTASRQRGSKIGANRGDTNQTLTAGADAPVQRWATALTANRTVTLSTTGAKNGDHFTVIRSGVGAFTLDVGGLKTIPNDTAATVEVVFDGSAWVLVAYGVL